MFRTFLLASFAGAGAASAVNPDLNARSNSPPSYFCNSATKKCSREPSVTAYCSSLLRVPKTKTKTKTITKCTTTTSTKITATKTVGTASTITSTVSLCATPLPTARAGGKQKAKREAIEERENAAYYGGISKPSCLSAYKNSKSVSSACSCFRIKPAATTTTTVTSYTTKKVVLKTDTTVSATDTTTFVAGTSLPFVVADYNVNYFAFGGTFKGERNGIGNDVFESQDSANAILFALNTANGRLVVSPDPDSDSADPTFLEGFVAVRDNEPTTNGGELEASRVLVEDPTREDFQDRYTPLTCSISQNPVDLTCPLVCRTQAGDVNQVGTVTDDASGRTFTPWYLGQPGEKSDDTYVTYAVTRRGPAMRGRSAGAASRMGRIRRN